MPAARRVLAVASALAVLAGGTLAASAGAAVVGVPLGCVIFTGDYSDKVLPLVGTGFAPTSSVTLSTSTTSKPTPSLLASVQTDAAGRFVTAVGAARFNSAKTREQSFNLIATQGAAPAIAAATTFRQVLIGYERRPEPTRPRQEVTHVARGLVGAGETVYAHFRQGGKTRITRSLGRASGPCGIATRRMRALPTRSRVGRWTVHVDRSETFSRKTRPQARLSFTVFKKPL